MLAMGRICILTPVPSRIPRTLIAFGDARLSLVGNVRVRAVARKPYSHGINGEK